jgi:hypothetical protein
MKKQLLLTDEITIIGKRWFQKTYGNTYHSVRILVNGEEVAFNPFTYGYENHYLQTAGTMLQELYDLPNSIDTQYFHVYRLQDAGMKLNVQVSDVERKKDLKV